MKNMTKFQLIFTGIFAAFIVIGVIVFSISKSSNSDLVENVTMWGPLSEEDFSLFWDNLPISQDKTVNINYVQKAPEQFDNDFIEALASGKGPDVFFLSNDSILRHKDKILVIPYDSYSERIFKDTFIEEGELFLTPDGILALPFIVDPLVMYWNRDIFSNVGISKPPVVWNDLNNLTKVFTQKDNSLNITQSAISFGEFRNVTNAKEILSALFLQWGTAITANLSDGRVVSDLDKEVSGISPAEAAMSFYTEFANPVKTFYSWNRSLPKSEKYFLSGDLAMYFGFASELFSLRSKNPNLNFDVASLPQLKDANRKVTYGKMYGLAITKNTKVINGAFKVATTLTSKDPISAISTMSNLPPVRRDLLLETPSSAHMGVFYNSALWSRGWLDPNKTETTLIFQDMIESVTSGRNNVSESVSKASGQFDILLGNSGNI